MKHRSLKRILAMLLTFSLVFGTIGAGAESSRLLPVDESMVRQIKIDSELRLHMDSMGKDDVVAVYLWIDDIDYNVVDTQVARRTGFSEESLMQESDAIFAELAVSATNIVMRSDAEMLSVVETFYENRGAELEELSADVNDYISSRRGFANEAYDLQNGSFANRNLRKANVIFQSRFTPMFIVELSVAEILALSRLENVDSLSLYVEPVSEDDNLNISLPSIGGRHTRDVLGFNGNGVRIGQIEGGRPETGIAELGASNITRGGTNNNTTHASRVAAIMVGQNGAAPQARLFSTTVDNFHANTEWLLSQNVTVINRSNSNSSAAGLYDNTARWVDAIVNQHNVSWVQTGGNDTSAAALVNSPGTAYNVINVGGINHNGTVATGNDTFYISTNYNTPTGPNKPDVVAPADSTLNGTTTNGTSFAAPHVTGIIAQMMTVSPALRLRPDAIKAAVMASTDRKTTGESLNSITNREGAGVINAIRAVNSISTAALQDSARTMSGSVSVMEFSLYPNSNLAQITVALSWFKRNTRSGTSVSANPDLTDLDLRIIDANGNTVASSISSRNNAEFVRFTPTSTARYTIRITRFTSNSTSERFSYAIMR